ncbi:MAG: SAM-dependent chlorinase/fluorinase [Alphaproteobacteria bacterium]|nr:SAM-dependent chlorinase/fluorinase [Alphaproteobacteria bacterium]
MIVLFTDFSPTGPYVGQMKAVLAARAAGVPVIDLMHDAPACDPRRAAYLLAALAPEFPDDAVFVAVVDPGVGTDRPAVVVAADGRRFVGPGNGLLAIVARRAGRRAAWRITYRPERLSASFHGRDLFAPVAAMLARGDAPPGEPIDPAAIAMPGWPDDLAEIIHVDGFGNAMTGFRADRLVPDAAVTVSGRRLPRRRTFGEAAAGEAFWYENANGLVEIAVNRGRADRVLGIGIGTTLAIEDARG